LDCNLYDNAFIWTLKFKQTKQKMKTLTINNQKYRIGFKYNRPNPSTQQTVAFIKNLDADVIIEATARCSKKDNFEKETGRKLALKRVLEFSPFNKEERSLIWAAYENRKTIN